MGFERPGPAGLGKMIMELGLPHGVIVAMIRRGGENVVPRGNVVSKGDMMLLEGDHVIPYTQERIANATAIQI